MIPCRLRLDATELLSGPSVLSSLRPHSTPTQAGKQMSGAVAILRRLWYRDPSTNSSSSPNSAANSPIGDKAFSTINDQRGSVGSDYTTSSRNSSPHRLVRALSSRLRPRSRTANSAGDPNSSLSNTPEVVETLKYKRPKSAVSSKFL